MGSCAWRCGPVACASSSCDGKAGDIHEQRASVQARVCRMAIGPRCLGYGCAAPPRHELPSQPSGETFAQQLAGHSIAELRDQYRRDLFDDYLPFVDRYAFDHERGGFMCEVDLDGRPDLDEQEQLVRRARIVGARISLQPLRRDPRQLEIAPQDGDVPAPNAAVRHADDLWPKTYPGRTVAAVLRTEKSTATCSWPKGSRSTRSGWRPRTPTSHANWS